MRTVLAFVAAVAIALALGGRVEAHGGGHFGSGGRGGGHAMHFAAAHRAISHGFSAGRSNAGGLRRGLARARYVHHLNALRHTRPSRHMSRRTRTARAAMHRRHPTRLSGRSMRAEQRRGTGGRESETKIQQDVIGNSGG